MQITINARTIGRILIGLIIGAAIGLLVWNLIRPDPPFDGTVDESRYQAVFLSNDRVYFGNLREAGEDFYELRNAFFIQERPGEGEDAPPIQEVQSITEEFHQPDDSMLINREFVVLVENLPPDSDVAEAIDRVRAEENP